MKKNKTAFETHFWEGFATESPFKEVDAFFDFEHPDYYKQHLSEAVLYSYKSQVYEQDNPSGVFVFYTAVCSFFKVCYGLQEKSKEWKVKVSFGGETVSPLSSLTKEEYDNPFMVFQKAFDEKTLEEFEFFLSQIIEFSLSPYVGDPGADLTTPYIHLIKMLDAVELIRERGVEKISKTEQMDLVAQ